MEATLDRSTTPATLRFHGELVIENAADLQMRLREALAAGEPVELDLAGVTQVDVTGLQLLTAAEQAVQALGLAWVRSGAVPKSLLQAAEDAGWEPIPFAGEAA